MRDGASSVRQTPVRATIRTVRVIWHDTRALIYTNAEQLQGAIDAVIRFTIAERETTALERAMDSTWASMDADAPLTYAVTSRQQKQQQHVNELTELATRMKAMYLRVSKALEQLDPALGELSKRLYSELASAGFSGIAWIRWMSHPVYAGSIRARQHALDRGQECRDGTFTRNDWTCAGSRNHCAAPLSAPPILVTPTLGLTFHRDGGWSLVL